MQKQKFAELFELHSDARVRWRLPCVAVPAVFTHARSLEERWRSRGGCRLLWRFPHAGRSSQRQPAHPLGVGVVFVVSAPLDLQLRYSAEFTPLLETELPDGCVHTCVCVYFIYLNMCAWLRQSIWAKATVESDGCRFVVSGKGWAQAQRFSIL